MYIGLYNTWGKKKHNVQRLDACAQSLYEFRKKSFVQLVLFMGIVKFPYGV